MHKRRLTRAWSVAMVGAFANCAGKTQQGDDGRASGGSSASTGEADAAGVNNDNVANAVGVGGGSVADSLGGSGGTTGEFFDTCPNLLEQLQCGELSLEQASEHGRVEEDLCKALLENPTEDSVAPIVMVNCELVDQFMSAQAGAPGRQEVENWTWDPSTNTVTFNGKWCDEIEAGVERIDFAFGCRGVP